MRPEINHFFRLVPFSGKWKLWVIIIFSLWFVCGMIWIRVCQYFWSRVCLFNSHLFCGDIYNCIRIFCVAGNRKSDSSWHKREFSVFFFFNLKGIFFTSVFFFFFCSCKVQIFSSREAFSFFLSLIYLSWCWFQAKTCSPINHEIVPSALGWHVSTVTPRKSHLCLFLLRNNPEIHFEWKYLVGICVQGRAKTC